MADFYSKDRIPTFYHRIGERIIFLIDGDQKTAPKITFRDIDTGKYFNKNTKKFEDYNYTSSNAGFYTFAMNELYDTNLYVANITSLPRERQQLLMELQTLAFEDDGGSASLNAVDENTAEVVGNPFYAPRAGNYDVSFKLVSGSTDVVFADFVLNGTDVAFSSAKLVPSDISFSVNPGGASSVFSVSLNGVSASDELSIKTWAVPFDEGSTSYDAATVENIVVYENSYERHVFGGDGGTAEASTCRIFGTILDVLGNPIAGEKVEVYLNRAGYFTHKAGLVGYAATTISDESGYWELPVISGLDVTINIPIIGFSQSGFVPSLSSVELTSETLLKHRNY